jgi:ubiquinone/menaquinone biosynthesis C-methylase UbiE/esterase/lipase
MNITSEIINFPNRNNKNIVAFYDFIDRVIQNNLIIIPPAYGETKKDSLKLSYFLVKNGFNVLRFDATNHVGESEGDMLEASFEQMKEDLLSALDFAQKEFKISSVGLAGTSLAVRVGIKAASQDSRIKFLVGLVPIVDIRSSLNAIYHQDVIGEILAGRYQGKTIDDIMGFEVNVNFALSAIENKYHDLATTREDLKKITIPLVLISAENDPWINAMDVKDALGSAGSPEKKFILVRNSMHQLNENPEAALFALQQAVIHAKSYNSGRTIDPQELSLPSQEEVSSQWLIEEERLRILLKKTLEGEKAFWEKYLNKFLLINKSDDYREFLKEVTKLLDIQPGEFVLDAGCGNGHFGAWLLDFFIEKIFREKIEWKNFSAVNYFGIDFVESRLKEGRLKHLNMLRRIYRELCIRERYKIINYKYALSDLDSPLPFKDNFFDKVCCNLVLSYVKNPGFTVSELFRVLKPGGRIIVTSLKPFADLSQIYRNFADFTENDDELDEARKLLSAAGKIKQKENAGIYNFFSEEELKDLFSSAKDPVIKRAFANQANLAVGEK